MPQVRKSGMLDAQRRMTTTRGMREVGVRREESEAAIIAIRSRPAERQLASAGPKEGDGASDATHATRSEASSLSSLSRSATPTSRDVVGPGADGAALAAATPVIEQFVQSCNSSNTYAAG